MIFGLNSGHSDTKGIASLYLGPSSRFTKTNTKTKIPTGHKIQPSNMPITRSDRPLCSVEVFVGIFIILEDPEIKISEDSKILNLQYSRNLFL